MRITATLYDRPGYSGGPAVNLCRLLPALRQRGHDLSCLVLFQEGEAPNGRFLESQGIDCRYLSMESVQWYAEQSANWILQQVRELAPDAFIANCSIPAAYVGALCREHGIPTVSTHRSDDALNWAIAESFGQRKSTWRASGMVCVSDALRYKMEARWPCVPLCTIPSGVPLPCQQSEHAPNRLRLVYAGRMETTQKAVDELCSQLFPWIAAHSFAELTLLGNGSQEEFVQREIEASGAKERIRLLPPQRGAAYSDILAQQDVMVLYSHYEGTPGAIMDGMAHGLIPLVRDIPGIRELVHDGTNGYVFSNMNAEVLDCLQRLYDAPEERKRLGLQARNTIAHGYSLNVATDRWEHFLSELVSDAGPRTPLPTKLPPLPVPHPDAGTEDLRMPTPPQVKSNGCLRRLLRGLRREH